MQLGMSYRDFWYGEPEQFVFQAEWYKRKSKDKFAQQDTMAWIIGSYVDRAVAHVVGSAFGEKGKPTPTYPDQPVYLAEIDETARELKRQRELRKQEANLLAALRNMGKTIEEAVR
jgi:hypothetical protein